MSGHHDGNQKNGQEAGPHIARRGPCRSAGAQDKRHKTQAREFHDFG
jgi:hypothetical protein